MTPKPPGLPKTLHKAGLEGPKAARQGPWENDPTEAPPRQWTVCGEARVRSVEGGHPSDYAVVPPLPPDPTLGHKAPIPGPRGHTELMSTQTHGERPQLVLEAGLLRDSPRLPCRVIPPSEEPAGRLPKCESSALADR